MMIPETKDDPIDILLVEDNPVDIMVTKEILCNARTCHNLHVTEDGEEAMEFLYKRDRYSSAPSPEIILLDLNLPRMDGREVLSEIKKDPCLRQIPVIILTTSEDYCDIIRCYRLQANCFITKPVDLEELTGILERLVAFWFKVARLPGRKRR